VSAALAYSAAELGPLLGVSTRHVYRMARAGEIPSIPLGGRVVFPKVAIDRWLSEAAVTGPAPAPRGGVRGDTEGEAA
jgi:excisionase family DNA binding protein